MSVNAICRLINHLIMKEILEMSTLVVAVLIHGIDKIYQKKLIYLEIP